MAGIAQIPFVFPSADGTENQVLRRSATTRTLSWGDYLRTTQAGLILPTLTGASLKVARVNVGETALEFAAIDLSGYVPYTGASSAVVLGANTLSTTAGLISPKLYPAADSTTAVQILKANGTTAVVTVDTTNGNVGIGTTEPGAKLDVYGTLRVSGDSTNYTNMVTNGQGYFTLESSGNVTTNGWGFRSPSGASLASMWTGDTNTATSSKIFFGPSSANFSRVGTGATAVIDAYNGNVGIGTTSPTAYLHLKAGTATASTAPLKFTSGVLNTTPEAGAEEFLTDDRYFTITTGAARKSYVLTDGSNLTSGRIPAATTNGRLIDGPTPAADNTYLNPTSITISKGLITAIS